MKSLKKLLLPVAAMAVLATSCKKDDDTPPPPPPAEERVLSGEVTTDKALTNDGVWTLRGYVYVKSGATLTIPAGTVIKSDVADKGALIVEPGGKLMAEGRADAPIVFTSGLPKGQRRPGDWGGIILLGNAPTNRSTNPTIEGGVNRTYGGSNAADNSGTLKYVRIEFAGIAASPGSEINGLTLGGVGSGTTIDHVMVSFGNDDGYEFFGGTVNAKHLIAYACSDDDYDFDFGYTGNIQYGISMKHPLYSDAGDASNGIEADNDGSGTNATPYTRPVLSNFTFIGPNKNPNLTHNLANRWRRAVRFVLRNSVMMGYPAGGFSMESAETTEAYKNGTSEFKNNLVHAVTNPFKAGSGATMTAAEIETMALAQGNMTYASADAIMLTKPFEVNAPNFNPMSGSPAASGANFTGLPSFFSATTFVGAVGGGQDWTTGWTNFDPNNSDY